MFIKCSRNDVENRDDLMDERSLTLRNLPRGDEEYLQINIRKPKTAGSQYCIPLKVGTTFREAPTHAWSAESVSSVPTGVGCAVLISPIDSAPRVTGVRAPEVR